MSDTPVAPGSYPRRPAFYSQKFARLLGKLCIANEIGAEACWFAITIACLEDAKRYSGPVNFFNHQLMPIIGQTREPTFRKVRDRLVQAGLLHVEERPKGSRQPTLYWTIPPADLSEVDSGAFDEPATPTIEFQRGYEAGYQAAMAELREQTPRTETSVEAIGMNEHQTIPSVEASYEAHSDASVEASHEAHSDASVEALSLLTSPLPSTSPLSLKNTGLSFGELEGTGDAVATSEVVEHSGCQSVQAERVAKPRARKPKLTSASEISIPVGLDTPNFTDVWGQWVQHQKELGRRVTPTCIRRQLAILDATGVEQAILWVSKAVTGGWQTLNLDGIKPPAQNSRDADVFAGLAAEDLRDVGKLIEFHKRASRGPNPVIGSTDSDRLRIISAAVQCWDRAEDMVRYFKWIVSGRQWHVIRDVDEDTANRLIKEHLFGVQKPHRRNSGCRSIGEELPSLLAGLGAGL